MDPITIGLALAAVALSGGKGNKVKASTAPSNVDEIFANAVSVWAYNGNPLGLDATNGGYLMCGIGDRESRNGLALDNGRLDGAGDKAPRSKPRTSNLSRWKILGDDPENPNNVLILPPDGRGWGRGVYQIDYWYHRDWFDKNPNDWWMLPKITDKAVEVLRSGWRANFDAVSPPDRLKVTVASYNCGAANALKGYRAGNPDLYTTGKDYSADTLRRMAKMKSQLTGNV